MCRSTDPNQKWESKLLETRVAEFARAPGAEDPPASHQREAPAASTSAPPANGSLATGAPNVLMPQPAGTPGLGDVQVKSEPDDVLRLRGGSVRLAEHGVISY